MPNHAWGGGKNVEKVELGANTSLAAFKKMVEGKAIQSASITGKYER